MKKIQIAGLTALSLFGSLTGAYAQSATTDPVGYTTVTCLANSDTIVSVPFLNTADSISSSVEGSVTQDGTKAEFTMAGITGLTTDQYVTTPSYVRFTSGTLEGNVYQITNNGATTVKIELNGDAYTNITAADTFKVYNFWTLGTLFPIGNDTIVESSGNLAFQQRTQILLPDQISTGTNIAPNLKYYQTSTGWKQSISGFPASDSTILWPDTYFIIRHPSTVTEATSYTATGTVDIANKFIIPLSTRTDGKQDNFIAIPRPVDVQLSELNLFESGAFVASTGNLAFQRRDELHVYANNAAAHNKAASAVYFHDGTKWKQSASGFPDSDSAIIKASEGFVIRKYQTVDGATSMWNNTPSY